jgi:three-Cys-motif partner protein
VPNGRSRATRSGSFGGPWTEIKLDKVSRYLAEYVKVMKNMPFTTMYVDAFAGTGTGFTRPGQAGSELFLDKDESVPAGSARLALNVSPPFARYVFIEKSPTRHRQLTALAAAHPDLADAIEFRRGDANAEIQGLCAATDWRRTRAVVFLDPYGMQVEWGTIEALGCTKAVDLWYLVPTGIAYARMMPRKKEPLPGWQERLDRAFGDGGWRQLYEKGTTRDLFEGEQSTLTRVGGLQRIEAYVAERLRSVFHAVSPSVG